MNSRKNAVLHVIESYGAGSARAAESYALATPEYRHVLLRRARPGEYVEGQELRAFAEVHELPDGFLSALKAVRRVTKMIRPLRIHAHSSWAGVLSRVALPPRISRRRLVYTPHCFAFERLDIALPLRAAFWVAEFVLSLNTDVIAACSQREHWLASRMQARRPPVLVPNVGRFPTEQVSAGNQRMVGIGRIGPQKDPQFFAAIADRSRSVGAIASASWLGGGDGDAELELRVAGLDVSGWLSTEDLVTACRNASVYVHTARWEGFPLAILEAHRAGLAIIARRIPALMGSPSDWLFSNVDEATLLLKALMQPEDREANRAAWSAALEDNTVEEQSGRLARVYSGAWR